eukprot:CAMPEP_0206487788 /NCGR_PEP_ID=MMETSP0324_2-20121206/41908_1 /ASSEMBLY_ACC=CAM_ASM_000836 /TAXON_ID=2866 /ORGANISM="Crypthecodinium cohnii, Strain Seligo" /LENGTH=306 /DNA_ID=CAMNT_0053966453 /DNA_START=115 /DNA_END=1035 /DNA_ORIENTATION=+
MATASDVAWGAAKLAVAAAAVGGVVYYLTREQPPLEILLPGAATSEEELEQLLPILEDLTKSLFLDCTDIASTTKTVHDKIDASQPMLAKQLKELWQRRVMERLQKTHGEVAARANLPGEALAELQQRYSGDETVAIHIEAQTAMLQDALSGVSPVLPELPAWEAPADFSDDKVIEVLKEAYALEEKKVKKALHRSRGKQQTVTVQDFDAMTRVARKDGLEQALKKCFPQLEGRPEVFHSVLAARVKTEAFASRKNKVDEASKPQWSKFFAPKPHSSRVAAKAASKPFEPGQEEGLLDGLEMGSSL